MIWLWFYDVWFCVRTCTENDNILFISILFKWKKKYLKKLTRTKEICSKWSNLPIPNWISLSKLCKNVSFNTNSFYGSLIRFSGYLDLQWRDIRFSVFNENIFICVLQSNRKVLWVWTVNKLINKITLLAPEIARQTNVRHNIGLFTPKW